MSEHTKKHRISKQCYSATVYITERNTTYAVPRKVMEKYILSEPSRKRVKNSSVTLESRYTQGGALLRGLRLRESLTQVEFAKKIQVTQANLSHIERGKRPIGKIIAKRIQKVFGTDYRYFLE